MLFFVYKQITNIKQTLALQTKKKHPKHCMIIFLTTHYSASMKLVKTKYISSELSS